MGSNVAKVVGEKHPVPMRFVGLADNYTDSGDPYELLQKYGLMPEDIASAARSAVEMKQKIYSG
jgi:transketolase